MARSGTLSADGSTESVSVSGDTIIRVNGNFGGGTITVNYQPEGETAVSDFSTTYTADFDNVFELPAGTAYLTLASSTSPSLAWGIWPKGADRG